MSSPSKTRSLQGQVAAARRWGRDSHDLERDYAAERLADYVRRVVDEAPPLTDEQKARVTAILRPTLRGSVGGGADAA